MFQINITQLKIPTGRRQTSWLLQNVTKILMWNYMYQETNSASGRLEEALHVKYGTSRLQHQCAKPLSHAASIRSIINRNKEHMCMYSNVLYTES